MLYLEKLYKFFILSTRIATVATGSVLIAFVILHIYVPLKYFSYIYWADALLVIIPSAFILFWFVVFTKREIINWRDQLINICICLGYSILIYMMLFFYSAHFAFPIISILCVLCISSLIGVAAISCANLLLYLFLMFNYKKYPTFRERLKERLRVNLPGKKQFLVLILSFFIAIGIPILIFFPLLNWNASITITPKDYHIELGFFGTWEHETYTHEQKQALNRHSATIVHYSGNAYESPNNFKQDYIDNMTFWKDHYSNIKFIADIPGDNKDFVWDATAENTTELAKSWVTLAKEEGLSNIKGLCFDIEVSRMPTVFESQGISTLPNRDRHSAAIDIWNDFFDWKEENASDMKTLGVFFMESTIDIFDGDNDMQITNRLNGFDVPRWDQYAPMIYRGWTRGTKPYGDYPVTQFWDRPASHYWLYSQLNFLSKAIEQTPNGNINQLSLFLGGTNCTAYGREVIQGVENGIYEYGFDSLIKDVLIAKLFGAPIVYIFMLHTVLSEGYSWGGFFESYGDDALDKLNDAVNGAHSTEPFIINYEGPLYWNYFGIWYFFVDELYSYDSIIGILYFSIILGFNIINAFSQEIRSKLTNFSNRNKPLMKGPDA